jgi:hypothetical protein
MIAIGDVMAKDRDLSAAGHLLVQYHFLKFPSIVSAELSEFVRPGT